MTKHSICIIVLFVIKISAKSLSNIQEFNEIHNKSVVNSVVNICSKDYIICDAKNVCLVFDCDFNYKTIYLRFYTPNELANNSTNNNKCQPQRNSSNIDIKCELFCKQRALLESDDKLQIQVSPSNNTDEDIEHSDLLSASFGPTYDSIWISSKYLLQPQGVVDCTQLFDESTARKLGSDPECNVIRNEISIHLRKNAIIIPNDRIVFNLIESLKLVEELPIDDELSDGNPFRTVDIISGLTVLLERPLYEKVPYFTISGFRRICTTDDKSKSLRLQLDNMIGNSGQPLKLHWNVTVGHTSNQTLNESLDLQNEKINSNLKLMTDLLPKQVYTQSYFELSHQFIISNLNYELTVVGENRFALLSLPLKYRISYSSEVNNFLISINGLPSVDVSVDNMFQIDILFCAQQIDNYLLDKFEFEVKLELNDIIVSKQTNRVFYIGANTLIGGQTYSLTASARYADTNEMDVYSHEFNTILEPLITLINTDKLVTGRGDGLILDGSSSFDPSNSQEQLSYQWTCFDIQRNSSECWPEDSPPEQTDHTKPILVISPEVSQKLLTSNSYKFTLTVAKDERQSTASSTVEFSEEDVPNIQFSAKNYRQRFKADPNRPQYLSYYIPSKEGMKTDSNWNLIAQNNPFQFNLSTEFFTQSEQSRTDSVRSLFIKIPEPFLFFNWFGLHTNKLYSFDVSAQYLSEDINIQRGLSSISIQMNDPPLPGPLEVIFMNGTGSLPKYKITTYGWTDGDYPLKYKFYYKYGNESTATTLAIVIGLSTSIEVILPGSTLDYFFEIKVGVKVCDKYRKCSSKETILNIENNSIDSNLTQILDKNCEPIKSTAIMRSLMQTFTGNDQLQDEFMTVVGDIFGQLFIAINESGQYNEIIQSVSETLSTSFSEKLTTTSTLNSVKQLKTELIKNLEIDNINSNTEDLDMNYLLYLDEYLIQANTEDSIEIFNDIQTYLSFHCKRLQYPSSKYSSNTNLVYYRVDYHSFTTKTDNQMNSSPDFIRSAGKIRSEVGSYMTLDQSVVNVFKDWMCEQTLTATDGQVIGSGNCFGVCIASAEMSLDNQVIASITKSEPLYTLWSPVLYIELYSPISGQKVTDLLKDNVVNRTKSLSFVLPLNKLDFSPEDLKCAYYDLESSTWSFDFCDTIHSSDKLLVCDCNRFGFFGALDPKSGRQVLGTTQVSTETITDTEDQNNTTSTETSTELKNNESITSEPTVDNSTAVDSGGEATTVSTTVPSEDVSNASSSDITQESTDNLVTTPAITTNSITESIDKPIDNSTEASTFDTSPPPDNSNVTEPQITTMVTEQPGEVAVTSSKPEETVETTESSENTTDESQPMKQTIKVTQSAEETALTEQGNNSNTSTLMDGSSSNTGPSVEVPESTTVQEVSSEISNTMASNESISVSSSPEGSVDTTLPPEETGVTNPPIDVNDSGQTGDQTTLATEPTNDNNYTEQPNTSITEKDDPGTSQAIDETTMATQLSVTESGGETTLATEVPGLTANMSQPSEEITSVTDSPSQIINATQPDETNMVNSESPEGVATETSQSVDQGTTVITQPSNELSNNSQPVDQATMATDSTDEAASTNKSIDESQFTTVPSEEVPSTSQPEEENTMATQPQEAENTSLPMQETTSTTIPEVAGTTQQVDVTIGTAPPEAANDTQPNEGTTSAPYGQNANTSATEQPVGDTSPSDTSEVNPSTKSNEEQTLSPTTGAEEGVTNSDETLTKGADITESLCDGTEISTNPPTDGNTQTDVTEGKTEPIPITTTEKTTQQNVQDTTVPSEEVTQTIPTQGEDGASTPTDKPPEERTEATPKSEESTTHQDSKDQDVNSQFTITSRYYIDTDFDEFIDNKMDETKELLIKQLRQIFSIPEEYRIDVMLSSGSVLIDLNITSDQQLDENSLLNQTFIITDLNGRQHLVRKLMSSDDKDKVTTTAGGAGSSTQPTESGKATSEVTSKVPKTKTSTTAAQTEPPDVTTAMSTSSVSTAPETTPTLMSMTITIDGEYDTVVGGDKQTFQVNVTHQLANYLRLPITSIVNMDSKSAQGKINVIFDLMPSKDPNFPIDEEALKSAKYEFEKNIRSNKVFIIDSTGAKNRVLSSVDNNDNSENKTENNGSANNMSYLIMGLAVGSVVIMVVLIIITACAVRSYMYRKFMRQIRPHTGSDVMIGDSPSRDGMHSVNTMRLIDGLSREGASSSGLYSYDSGVWVGAGPEPEISVRGVPEPPFYFPPNDVEISITPKPPPEVIRKLKSDWSQLGGHSLSKRRSKPKQLLTLDI